MMGGFCHATGFDNFLKSSGVLVEWRDAMYSGGQPLV